MIERDLRSAYDQLKEDVLMNVQTEERLEQITKPTVARRRPTTAVAAALASAAAVALVVGGVVIALRPGGADPVPPATGPATTVVDTTVPATTAAPAPLLPVPDAGTVLIADPSVLAVQEGDGYITYVADRVIGDGIEGIVVQIDQRIMQIGPSGESQLLVQADDFAADIGPVTIRLEDLAMVDGAPHVLFIMSGGSADQPFEDVWIYDLSSGAAAPIYGRSEFESTITRASLANDVLLVTVTEEGTTYLEYLDRTGAPLDIGTPFKAGSGTSFESPVVQAVLSPDGSTMVYAQIESVLRAEEGNLLVDLVQWDLSAGVEVARFQIDLGSDLETGAPRWPGRLDYDGTSLVLGRQLNLIAGSETVTPLRISSIESSVVAVDQLGASGVPSIVK